MKALLVYPKYPETFWSFKYALKFIDKKVGYPPLGALTIASMLPKEWEKKLIDLNADKLKDKHLKWADYVFISAMDIQRKSAEEVIKRCKEFGVKIVAGGPLFSMHYDDFKDIDHLVHGEAETALPEFINDLEKGTTKQIYSSSEPADMEKTPLPMWELLNMKRYATMSIQYSRGCPYDCEFCCITKLFGRRVRTKSKEQIIEELETLHNLGWKDQVTFVDDNFIGNRIKLKKEILPAITEWMKKRNYPFSFLTQVSMDLADDEELMKMMALAGFNTVFVGIETIDDACLAEAGKFINRDRDLVESVRKMHQFKLQVYGGFIVGFDNDNPSIFDRMIQFIQESGTIVAMVSLLSAARGTKLYKRLKEEKRLISNMTGDNTDFTINFIPKMDKETLLEGYRKIVQTVYSPKKYYARILEFLKEYNPPIKTSFKLNFSSIKSLIRTIFVLGIFDKGRLYYWKIFFWSLFNQPKQLFSALTFLVYGYHFRKIFKI